MNNIYPLETTFEAINSEVAQARGSFPDQSIETLFLALSEEVGELAKAILEEPSARIVAEAIQVACMAIRIIEYK